jgi:hypothetical protein
MSSLLPSMDIKIQVHYYEEALNKWLSVNNEAPSSLQIQKSWNIINIKRLIERELQFGLDFNKAHFKAIQQRESGAWLHAFPSKNIGLDKLIFKLLLALDSVAVFLKSIFVVVVLCQTKLVFTVLAALKAWEEWQDIMNLILLFNEPYHPLIFIAPLNPMVYLVMMARDLTEQPLFRGQRVNVLYGTLLVLIP